jgi:dipeptidyl aminopeptidase/acylaminoacyl peptidase
VARRLARTILAALVASLMAVSLAVRTEARGPATVPAQDKRTIIPDDLVGLREVAPWWTGGDIQVSPDGKRVAFVVTEPADPNKPDKPRDTNIWMVPTDGSEPPRLFAASKSDTHPRWSPDGRLLAFLSKGGQSTSEEKEAKNQIYLMRTDGGEAEQLTNIKNEVLDFKWSPDGKMIAFTARDAMSDEEAKKHKEGNDAIYVGHDYKYARLWVVALSDRRSEQVTQQNFEVVDLDWSPDGNELALIVSSTPRPDDLHWHDSLVVIRRATGVVLRTLSRNASFPDLRVACAPRWSPDGRTIVFGELTPKRIAAWLASVPAAGGPIRYLLRDYPGTIRRVDWELDSKHLLAESNEGTKEKFLRIDASTEALTKLGAETALPAASFSASADRRTIAYAYSDGAPPEVWTFTIGESPRQLTHLNPQVGSWRLGRVEETTWKNKKDGQTIYGVLVTPPDFKAGLLYPTVALLHGGPENAWWNGWLGSWHEWAQLLASHGYVVLLPNERGSTGQGWRFAEAVRNDQGGADFQDIMDGVDSLIERKIADSNRLGVGGYSYGGFMAAWTVTQTDRFKVAVVGAGMSNWFSEDASEEASRGYLQVYLPENLLLHRAEYDKHSPMIYLQNCKTPTLILHGQLDETVPVSQGWEFYNGLKMLGVAAEMVIYPREPHAPFKERAHQVDLLTRVLAWYDKYLKSADSD